MPLRSHPTPLIFGPTDGVAGGTLPPPHSDRDAVGFPRHQRKRNGVIVPCGQKVRSHVGSRPVTVVTTAFELAQTFGAKLTVLHVVVP